MILIFEIFIITLGLSALLCTQVVHAAGGDMPFHRHLNSDVAVSSCRVDRAEVIGLKGTDHDWFQNYLDLSFPKEMTTDDALAIRNRIMTTDVFSQVTVRLDDSAASACVLVIEVSEKWTTIPVIRGAYGGGTPLLVIGGYETHAFGRLYSLGLEARRYGSRPPGFFLFGKMPRAWNGYGSVGGELWLDRRRRAFFDSDGNVNAYADSEAWTGKSQLLYPLHKDIFGNGILQGGFHAELIRESPAVFNNKELQEDNALKPLDVSTSSVFEETAVLLPMLAYDRLTVDQLEMYGERVTVKVGAQASKIMTSGASEFEGFFYRRVGGDVNIALHGFAGVQGSNSLRNLYFLGGFDSVRGLPDGIHYGTKMAYSNAELRWRGLKHKYLQAQTAFFLDHGSAFSTPGDWSSHRETAVGLGVRMSVPQIYRLVLRVDYGWSIGQTKTRGLSIGLGQFFQPYKLFY